MRWSWLVLPAGMLLAASAAAQTQPKPGDKPEGWQELEVEPDKPDPPPAPKPKPAANQYTPIDPEPPSPAPAPPPSGETVVITENRSDSGSSLPESILWMKQWKPRFLVRHVRMEFDVWDHAAGTSYMWNFIMALGVDEVPVLLDIELPFTHYDLEPNAPDMKAHTHFGNATLGLHGGGVIANVIGLWGGGWVGIPSAKDISSIDLATTALAAYSRNFVEAYRFLPNSIPFRLAFGIEGQPFPLLYLRSTISSVTYFPNVKPDQFGNVPSVLEQIHEAEVLSPVGAGGGLRFSSVFDVDDAGLPEPLHALEPFISYQPPYDGPYAFDLFARLGFLFGLNNPFSLVTNEKVFTITTQVGYRF